MRDVRPVRHRHLERHAALRRPRRGGRSWQPSWRASATRRCGSPTSAATCSDAARQPARGDDDGDDRHRDPQHLDAHARRRRPPSTPRSRPSTATASCAASASATARSSTTSTSRATYQKPRRQDGRVPRRPRRRRARRCAADDRVHRRPRSEDARAGRATRTAGTHPYLVTPEHTAPPARRVGPDALVRQRAGRRARHRPDDGPGDGPHPPQDVSRPAQLHEQLEAPRLHRRRPRRRRQRPPRRRPRRVGRRGRHRRPRPGAPRRRRRPRLHPGPHRATRAAFPLEPVARPSRPALVRCRDTYDVRPVPALRRADGVARTSWPPTTPTSSTVESYGRSHEGRDLWLVTVTDCVDRRPRHQAGALGRRQHPRRRADGHRRRLLPAPAPRRRPRVRRPDRSPRRCGRARSTSCRGSTPTAPSGRWPTRRASAGRARGRGRGPTPTAGRAPTSRTSTATAASCRCASPIPTGRGWRTPRTPACWSRSRSTARRPARRATGMLDEGTIVDHDGFTIPTPAPARGARHEPQLPGRVGHRRARLRRPSAVASRRSTPSCGRSSPGPTSAATTPSTPAAACCCGRRRPQPTRRCRPSTCGRGSSSASSARALTGYTVHSVFEDFTWDKR